MKYCQKCGNRLDDDANYCTRCGYMVGNDRQNDYNYSDDDLEMGHMSGKSSKQPSESSKTVGTIIIVFMIWAPILSLLTYLSVMPAVIESLGGLAEYSAIYGICSFIPLAWQIPMIFFACRQIKKKKKFSVGFAVCTLLFCNLISGILMFVYKPYGDERYYQ